MMKCLSSPSIPLVTQAQQQLKNRGFESVLQQHMRAWLSFPSNARPNPTSFLYLGLQDGLCTCTDTSTRTQRFIDECESFFSEAASRTKPQLVSMSTDSANTDGNVIKYKQQIRILESALREKNEENCILNSKIEAIQFENTSLKDSVAASRDQNHDNERFKTLMDEKNDLHQKVLTLEGEIQGMKNCLNFFQSTATISSGFRC